MYIFNKTILENDQTKWLKRYNVITQLTFTALKSDGFTKRHELSLKTFLV